MADADKQGGQLSVAIHEHVAYVRLRDRGSFKVSKPLKQFGVSAIDQGVEKIVVDMDQCVGMDSTFMGVLAGLAFRLKKKTDGVIVMVNLTSRTRGLLATLGLDQLVETFMQGDMPSEFATMLDSDGQGMDVLKHDPASKLETAEMMLEAHQNLVQVSNENLPRFRDVLAFLREDIEKAESSATEPSSS